MAGAVAGGGALLSASLKGLLDRMDSREVHLSHKHCGRRIHSTILEIKHSKKHAMVFHIHTQKQRACFNEHDTMNQKTYILDPPIKELIS